MAEQNPYLTITLTAARPVKILKADWPVIAEATDSAHEGQYDFQANRKSKMSLRVRQHEDGRAIVYGSYSYDSQFQGERDISVRGGVMLEPMASHTEQEKRLDDAEDIPAAIREVARDLAERIGEEHFGLSMLELAHECVAKLPAVEV